MKITLLLSFCLSFLGYSSVYAQQLSPQFEKTEYQQLIKLLEIASRNKQEDLNAIGDFKHIYSSEIVGLDNQYWLWENGHQAIIGIRGSDKTSKSWLANFYAAMVPAKGRIQYADDQVFNYELAAHPEAAVHVGWLFCTAYLSELILPQLDSLYAAGIRQYFLAGHSQGGAICYLLMSHFLHLQEQGELPKDIQFKMYASAAPKVGNLYYAYDFESKTQEGWAYNVINPLDWVPEMPFSVQTITDFNAANPFSTMKSTIGKQSFFKRLYLNHLFKKLDKPTRKAQQNFQDILGDKMYGLLQKQDSHFVNPSFYPSSNYVRIGRQYILQVDSLYEKEFPTDPSKLFRHHDFKAYQFLAK